MGALDSIDPAGGILENSPRAAILQIVGHNSPRHPEFPESTFKQLDAAAFPGRRGAETGSSR